MAIPWVSFTAFTRISTNPRALRNPLTPGEAWQFIEGWIDAPMSWIPEPGRGHRQILGRLISDMDLRANLISDAALAALCTEHGFQIVSADSDFARLTEVTWINPIQR